MDDEDPPPAENPETDAPQTDNDPLSLNFSPQGGGEVEPELAEAGGTTGGRAGTTAIDIPRGPVFSYPSGDQRRYDAIATAEKTMLPQGKGIDWGRVSNGGGTLPLERMTIAQVAAMQAPGGAQTDFGGLQLNRQDLLHLASLAKLDPSTALFDQANQENMADAAYAWHGSRYWKGFESDPSQLSVARGLISGATQAAQEWDKQSTADTERLRREVEEYNARVRQLEAKGEFNTDRWRNERWQAFQKEKELADTYEQIRKNVPTRTGNDLAQGVGSMMQAVSFLGGNLASMPAGRAAAMLAATIRARTAGNDADFKENWTMYQDAMKNVIASAGLESNLFKESIEGQNADVAATVNKLRPLAIQTNNLGLLQKLDEGRLHDAVTQIGAYDKLVKQLDLQNRQLVPVMNGEKMWDDLNEQYLKDHPEARTEGIPGEVELDFQRQVAAAVSGAETGKLPGKGATAADQKEQAVQDRAAVLYTEWANANKDATAEQKARAKSDTLVQATRDFAAGGSKETDPLSQKAIDESVLAAWRADPANKGKADPTPDQMRDLARKYQIKPAAGEGLTEGKPFDIVDKDGNVVQTGVQLRELKNPVTGEPAYVHAENSEPLQLKAGEHVKQITAGVTSGGRAGAQVLRQMVGGKEVLSDLQNVVQLPVGTTTGLLGTVHPGVSVMGALIGDLTRTLTTEDSRFMQSSMAGVTRELSILMSPVYGGGYASAMLDPLVPKAGDSLNLTIFNIARIKQSADNAIEEALHSPLLSNDQKEEARKMRAQLDDAVPWSPSQALAFAHTGKRSESFTDYVKRNAIDLPSWAINSATGKDGTRIYIDRDGNLLNKDGSPYGKPAAPTPAPP